MKKICITCRNIFNIKPAIVRRGFGKYCSQKCYIQKGKVLSEKTKYKMSLARKGKPQPWRQGKKHSMATRLKMSKVHSGSNHWNWKGGKETENVKSRRSIEYKLWREAVLQRDNWTCINCGVVQGWNKEKKKHIDIQVDHRKSFSKYPDLRFDINNGRVLCKDCHVQTATWGNNQYLLR